MDWTKAPCDHGSKDFTYGKGDTDTAGHVKVMTMPTKISKGTVSGFTDVKALAKSTPRDNGVVVSAKDFYTLLAYVADLVATDGAADRIDFSSYLS